MNTLPKVGDRVRITEYYPGRRLPRNPDHEGPATVTATHGGYFQFRLDSNDTVRSCNPEVGDRWEPLPRVPTGPVIEGIVPGTSYNAEPPPAPLPTQRERRIAAVSALFDDSPEISLERGDAPLIVDCIESADSVSAPPSAPLPKVGDPVGTPSAPPTHYAGFRDGVQPMHVTRWLYGPYANAVKYLCRAHLKGSELTDLRKAARYLQDAIDHAVPAGRTDRVRVDAEKLCESLLYNRGQAIMNVIGSDPITALVWVDAEIARLTAGGAS